MADIQPSARVSAIATPTGTAAWTTDVINGDYFQFAPSGLAATSATGS